MKEQTGSFMYLPYSLHCYYICTERVSQCNRILKDATAVRLRRESTVHQHQT